MSDKKKSLAERIREKQAAANANDEKPSLADKLAAKRDAASTAEEADDENLSLAEKLAAKRDAEQTPDDAPAASATGDNDGFTLAESLQSDRQARRTPHKRKQRLKAKAAEKPDVITDETDAEPLDEETSEALSSRLDELTEHYHDLLERVEMTALVRETTSLGNDIEGLPDDIAEVRQRGYVFRNYLENKVEVIAEQWDRINDKIERWVEEEADALDEHLAEAQSLVDGLAVKPLTTAHQHAADQLDSRLDMVETRTDAASERIRTLYDEVSREVSQTQSQLRQIVNYLDLADEATFDLSANEAIYMVAKAEWDDNKDNPDGYLYLTDERLVFEQKEKVGKRFGMFGGEDVQQVLWEAPLDALEESDNEDKGMFGGTDLVHLSFGAGAPYAKITVEIKGGVDSSVWSTQINRAASGKIREESTIEPDPDLIERLREAPTDCPTCDATLPSIDTGDTEVSCKYCGTVVRI